MRFVVPILIGVIGLSILLSLGVWQLRRLDWKQGVLAEIERQLEAPPVAVPAEPTETTDKFLIVRANGRYTGEEIHVLISTKERGAGYRLISAFEMDRGQRILVDRGFIATDAKMMTRQPAATSVTGALHWPDETDVFTPDNDLEKNIWFARDVETMAAALQTDPILIVLEQTTELDPPAYPLPLTTAGIPNDHLGYAVTWFGLAAVWAGMTALWLWRIRRRTV